MVAIFGTCAVADCAEKSGADIMVYGKIFTSENNRLVEIFAVKECFSALSSEVTSVTGMCQM